MVTKKQKATVEILKENPNMKIGPAMVKGGYSKKTSLNPKRDFLDLKGTKTAMDKYREYLRGRGLNEARIADKTEEWLEATKVKTSLTEPDRVVPDYETQLKAGEMIRKDLGIETNKEGLNIIGEKVLIVPSELMEKYGIKATPNTTDSSKG